MVYPGAADSLTLCMAFLILFLFNSWQSHARTELVFGLSGEMWQGSGKGRKFMKRQMRNFTIAVVSAAMLLSGCGSTAGQSTPASDASAASSTVSETESAEVLSAEETVSSVTSTEESSSSVEAAESQTESAESQEEGDLETILDEETIEKLERTIDGDLEGTLASAADFSTAVEYQVGSQTQSEEELSIEDGSEEDSETEIVTEPAETDAEIEIAEDTDSDSDSDESVIERSILGTDDRYQVSAADMAVSPLYKMVEIITEWPDGTYTTATGFLAQARKVVTAGDAIYDPSRGGFAYNAYIIPARYGDEMPFGYTMATTFVVPQSFMDSVSIDPNSLDTLSMDIGVITTELDYSTTLGYMGVESIGMLYDESFYGVTYAYDFDSNILIAGKGNVAVDPGNGYLLASEDIDIAEGVVGAPLTDLDFANDYVCGISVGYSSTANYFVRFGTTQTQFLSTYLAA